MSTELRGRRVITSNFDFDLKWWRENGRNSWSFHFFLYIPYLCLIFVHIFLNQLEKCPLLLNKLIAIAH